MAEVSTGIVDLDRALGGLLEGDNVVWKVDDIGVYLPFVRALAGHAEREGEQLVYFRFAQHEPLLEATTAGGVEVCEVRPDFGFEAFITEIHRAIREHEGCIYYVFDSLSDLSNTCYSDRMIGNFFRLTCPLLRRLDTVAYFAMYRSFHSYHAADPVRETTQILIDAYRYGGSVYMQPIKIFERETPERMRMHIERDGRFLPVTSSAQTAAIVQASGWPGLPSASYRMVGVWDRTFLSAERVAEGRRAGSASPDDEARTLAEIVRLIVTNDERMLPLAERYFTLPDVLAIWRRMIGTGMIGGKAFGMLLARAVLRQSDPEWTKLLEPHDSFYIGSDVYYTFLVANDCWWERQRQKDPETFLEGNEVVRSRLLSGTFPDYIVARFADLLDYFGQAPIIVRSSSLLEDNFGNAFSGKYESVFCVNQGTPEERLDRFMDAVRRIYASTMSDEALTYRASRGVLGRDEQMALLVQRVSGTPYGGLFLPQLAGVGYSFNPYAWNRAIDPAAGMLRLVFGLGTRAVDRNDDDYTRVVSLSAPHLRPDASVDDRMRHAQRQVDVLDITHNEFRQVHFLDIVNEAPDLPVARFATRDPELARTFRRQGMDDRDAYVLTLDPALEETPLVGKMRKMLGVVRDAYGTDVDVEFTANFDPDWGFTINVLQCRPLQVQLQAHGEGVNAEPLPQATDEHVIMRSSGGVIGHSRTVDVATVLYVAPARYAELPEAKRYALARVIGKVVKQAAGPIVLIGPGRWGTSTPSLGVPVSFSEIRPVSVLCEIDVLHEGLVPDLSLGTHFFNDLVEQNILYVGHFAGNTQNVLDDGYLRADSRALGRLVSGSDEWEEILFVRPGAETPERPALRLYANAIDQISVLYTTP